VVAEGAGPAETGPPLDDDAVDAVDAVDAGSRCPHDAAAIATTKRTTARRSTDRVLSRGMRGCAAVAHHVLTLTCADRPGIVHAVAAGLLEARANIVENSQFGDDTTGTFCMRTRFETVLTDIDEIRAALEPFIAPLDANVTIRDESKHLRALVMVSKQDHCLLDLLYRWEHRELPVHLPLVVGNHPDCAELCHRYGVPFVHLPVTSENKAFQEKRLLELVDEHAVDMIVLARYMQILTEQVCERMPGRIINIHHSFLPGFKGARPYHQAHERGVKLVGATAHYVTADLDEGPIIEQDVVRVHHAMSPEELASLGRDVERLVLSRAVRLHADSRVVVVGRKTVVFS
jgi:formyltetrahydrofolate deformylase